MWARIEKNTVCETVETDPAGRFEASLTWVGCPDGVGPGWYYTDGGGFTQTPPEGGEETLSRRVDALEKANALLLLQIAALIKGVSA